MMAKASRSAGPRMAARSGRFLVSHDYARPTERVEFLVDCIGLVTAVRRQPNLKERCCAPAPDDSAHDHRQSVSATRPALTNASWKTASRPVQGWGAAQTRHSPHRCMVQVPGDTLRIKAADLRRVLDRTPLLTSVLNQYVQYLLVQYSQVSLCNARHSIHERLAR